MSTIGVAVLPEIVLPRILTTFLTAVDVASVAMLHPVLNVLWAFAGQLVFISSEIAHSLVAVQGRAIAATDLAVNDAGCF